MSRKRRILGLLCVSIAAGCGGRSELDDYLAQRAAGAQPTGNQGAAGAMPARGTNPVTSPMGPNTASGVSPTPPLVPVRPSTPPPTTPPPTTPLPASPPPATPPPATPLPATPPAMTPPADACGALKSCCVMVEDEDVQGACDEVASAGDAAVCTAAIAEVCSSAPPTVPPDGDACSALETCCADLEDEDGQEACDEVASNADEAECGDALADLCSDDGAPGDASCRELQSCCADLEDEDEQEECEDVVADADSDACTEAGGDFCS